MTTPINSTGNVPSNNSLLANDYACGHSQNAQSHPLDADQPFICQLHPHSHPINTTNHSDAQQKLEEGIDISQETIRKIQQLMPKILYRKDHEEITWHAKEGNLVFSLTSIPDLIFKMASPGVSIWRAGGFLSAEQLSELRFANMVKAIDVCIANQLDCLVIPHAKKFNVDKVTLIAEERIYSFIFKLKLD